MIRLAAKLILMLMVGAAVLSPEARAQDPVASFPPLSGPQKRALLLIAREALDANIEGRPSREPSVEERLNIPQPMVVSIYVDGKLRGRAWALKNATPLFLTARNLAYEAIKHPKVSKNSLDLEELGRAEVSVAVLSNYARAVDERDVPPGSAVIIYHGFIEWMAMPGDVESKSAADLLRYACAQAGLRPNVWLLPQTAIFSATVEESRENREER